MPMRKVGPSRRTTDGHLATEREKTDAELSRRVDAADKVADAVLSTERSRAAEVLRTSRERSDAIATHESSPAENTAIGDERGQADQSLRGEYDRADEAVAQERAERARIVVDLLEPERRETDRGLLLGRAAADEVLKRREDFLGMVSHDLRNELGGIGTGVAQIMQRAPYDDTGRRIFRTATNVQRIALRMSRLIGDLLDIAAIEAGKLMIVPDDDDLARVLDGVIESFQPVASAKGIVLTAEMTAEAKPLRFDHQRVHQVFGNLLTNALRFTPKGGNIAIRAESKGRETHLSVSDTGPGIAANRLDAIFEQFAQGHRADRNGLGLGLYIARRIVEAHGGRIWAESTPGQGSTFTFTLLNRPVPEPAA